MSKNLEQSGRGKSSKEAVEPGSALLTRSQAAALLGCSISSIRRLEGEALHPVVRPDGVHLFDASELARYAGDRTSRPAESSKAGERDARVFEALEEGTGMREIVTMMRLPVDVATKLHAAWLKMGSDHDMVLSGERVAQLSIALGGGLKRPVQLVQRVKELAADCVAVETERSKLDNQLTDALSIIGQLVAADPGLAKVIAESSDGLDPDLIRRMDMTIKYFMDTRASLQNGSPSTVREIDPA